MSREAKPTGPLKPKKAVLITSIKSKIILIKGFVGMSYAAFNLI
jgi:hypothetical protein